MKNKATISDNVSEQLEIAAQEALEKMDPFQQLMNAGVEYEKEKQEEQPDKPKRKRRTKAEMKAARQELPKEDESIWLRCSTPHHLVAIVEWNQDKDDDNVLPTKIEIPDSILIGDWNADTIGDYLSDTVDYCHNGFSVIWPERHENHDQFCQWEIEKAHFEAKENPDFDFRSYYQDGDKVYLVRHYQRLQTKELVCVKLRTIYARSMVGVVDKQYCQCIGYSDKDNIFYNEKDALSYFDSINARVQNEDDEETGKKKRRRRKSKDTEEDFEVSTDEENEDNE